MATPWGLTIFELFIINIQVITNLVSFEILVSFKFQPPSCSSICVLESEINDDLDCKVQYNLCLILLAGSSHFR